MDIGNMTINEAREIANIFGSKSATEYAMEIGKPYFVRTCTYHYTGRVKSFKGGFVEMEQAAWIADSGRLCDALKTGEFSEVEPFPGGIVWLNISAIVDFSLLGVNLPESQK